MRRDLLRIDRRLGELDAERESKRDIAAETLEILRRPKPKEGSTMAENYFVGSDGRRRDFDSTGRELGTQGNTQGTMALRRPTLSGSPGGAPMSSPTGTGSPLARPLAASIQRPDARATPTISQALAHAREARPDAQATPADARASYGMPSLAWPALGTEPSSAFRLTRPRPGQQQVAPNLARPTANPVTMATGIPFDEAVRRGENAMSSARVRSPAANTRSGMQRHHDAAAGMRDFWLDQARSVPDAARRMAEQQAEQGSAERIAGTEARTAMQRTHAENDARLQGIERQERGAMARVNAEGQFNLRRPQRPITLADGTLAAPGPDGTLQPYTLPDGTPARGAQSQVDQSALARLTSDMTKQFLGTDNYGMVPDANSQDGVRYPTPEERIAAFQQASTAAREALSGATATDSQRQQQAPARPTSARPASQSEFLERARAANPGYSDEELSAFYTQNYESR